MQTIEPSKQLREAILTRMYHDQRQVAKARLGFVSVVALVLFAVLIPAVRYLIADFSRSGFYQYASLLVSDSRLAITYWHDFVPLLAESFPLVSLVTVLAIALLFLRSIKTMVLDLKMVAVRPRTMNL